MKPEPFYVPVQTKTPGRFQLLTTPSTTVGPATSKFLMGGVNFGAALEAMEAVTGRPILYASAQFLSFAALNEVVDIDVVVHSEGRSVTQAATSSRVNDRDILRVSAALGERASGAPVQFALMPEVAPPLECAPLEQEHLQADDLGAHIEKRLAIENDKQGYAATWIRCTDGYPTTSGLIALIGDHLAGALPRTRGASSLDNHLRIFSRASTRWFLCETQFLGFSAGFLHGETRLFAETGELIALASQTAALPRKGGDWAQSHVER